MAFIDATIVNIAFPDLARSFPGTSISTLSWVLNAYNVVFAAFLVAAARIADVLGRRRVLVFGLEVFTVGSLLCAIAPSAAALNVLFLTGVWRYSVSQAGLALTVGPLVAVVVAGPASRLAQRVGPRPVLVAGGLLWGGAVLWFAGRVGTTPDFVGQWLPGMVLLGIGAGTLFPNLSGTAIASAPGENFATATGINSVARQVGAALGVAIVVAIIGTPTPTTAYAAFHHAWTFGAVCLFAAGLGCLLVGHVNADQAPAPGNAAPGNAARGDDARGDAAQGDAARTVLAETESRGTLRSPRPRLRRVIAPDSGDPAVPRAESVAEFLARTSLFSGIDPQLVEQLAAKSRTRRLAAGKWLFRERDPGDEMYVVRAGRLEAVDEDAGAVIGESRRGDVLGEAALLTDSPRSASVRAARATEVIAVDQADFTELLHGSPALSLALNRSLSRRLQNAGPHQN